MGASQLLHWHAYSHLSAKASISYVSTGKQDIEQWRRTIARLIDGLMSIVEYSHMLRDTSDSSGSATSRLKTYFRNIR